jgi:hypothetical protein
VLSESSYYIATSSLVSEVEDYQSSEYGMQVEYSKTCYVDGLANSSEEANNRRGWGWLGQGNMPDYTMEFLDDRINCST